MPRFYFHMRSGPMVEPDLEGLEFGSLEEAIEDARQAGAEIIEDEAVEKKQDSCRCFEITDDTGRVVATVPLVRD